MKGPKEISFCICHAKADAEWGDWIAEELSDFRVPTHLVGRKGIRGEPTPGRLRSATILELDDGCQPMGKDEKQRLKSFDFLIVVCSPKSALSDPIGERIGYYKSIGRSDRVLAAIVDGVPGASEGSSPAQECFHICLRRETDEAGMPTERRTEPLAADFRLNGKHRGWHELGKLKATLKRGGMTAEQAEGACAAQLERLGLMRLKLIAGMLGVNLGELTQRESVYVQKAVMTKRKILISATSIVVALGAMIHLGISNYSEAQRKAAEAKKKKEEAESAFNTNSSTANIANALSASQAELNRIADERMKGLEWLRKASGETGNQSRKEARAMATEHLRRAAESGDPVAMLTLGKLLTTQPLDGKDLTSGLEWLVKASALQGPSAEAAEAQFVLAGIHDEGKITAKDAGRALSLSEKAAKGGHKGAMEQLAYMLERGHGGPERIPECMEWYRKAAEAGNPEGHFALHLINLQGRNFFARNTDPRVSDEHLSLAAKGGSPRAMLKLGQKIPNSSASGSHDENFKFLERAASAGLIDARLALADLYMTAKDRPPNIQASLSHLDKALELSIESNNLKVAESALNSAYRYSLLPQLKSETSIEHWAQKGSSLANIAMAERHQSPSGSITNQDAYLRYMGTAARNGSLSAQHRLGSAALSGKIKGLSKQEALSLLEKSAEKNYMRSLIDLMFAYRNGKDVPRDWKKSAEYASKILRLDKNYKVDWTKYPARFRPGFQPKQYPWEFVKPREPVTREDQIQVDAFLREFKPKPESAKFIAAAVGPEKDVPSEILLNVGIKLLSHGHSELAERLLLRCVQEATWDERMNDDSPSKMDLANHRNRAATALANYYKVLDRRKHALWTVISAAVSRIDSQASRIVAPLTSRESRLEIRPAPGVSLESLREAALLLEKIALTNAATSAGFHAPEKAMQTVTPEEASKMMSRARNLMRDDEFPEETEEALSLLSTAADNPACEAEASRAAAACARRLGLAEAAFYWNLRAALCNSTQPLFRHQEAGALSLAYATGKGVAPDPVEARKWQTIAEDEFNDYIKTTGDKKKDGEQSALDEMRAAHARISEEINSAIEKAHGATVANANVRLRLLLHGSLSNSNGRRGP